MDVGLILFLRKVLSEIGIPILVSSRGHKELAEGILI
jgi:hypothetical protein